MDLTTFQHSLFLSALGNAILNSLWQGFLLWIIYETVIISYKKTDAKFKHNLSVLFIFCSFIWFVCTFIFKLQISEKISSFANGINNLENLDKPKSSFSDFFSSFTGNILPYLSVAYISLLFFLMVKLFTAYRHVHFIAHKNLLNPPAHLQTFASKVSQQLNIPKKIIIWISNHIEVPATIGFIKPVILIPLASINQLTASQLEAIILHELSHIKRNDYLINLLVSIIETILFFNPFVALFIKIIKRERENCCDDFVLQYRYDAHSYASALLRLEQSRKNNIQLALGAVSGKKQLLLRIKRITGTNNVNQFNYGQKLLALLITTSIFCSLAWLSPSGVAKKEVKLFPPKTISNIVTRESQFDEISKIVINENNIAGNTTSKNKKVQQKIKGSKEKTTSDLNENPEANFSDEGETNMMIDKNSSEDLPDNNQTPVSGFNQNNFKPFIFKNIPKQEIENVIINIDYNKINEGLQKAFGEINKINWSKVQYDISKSFSNIKTEHLSENEKAQLIKVRKYLSLINLDKQQFNASKILKEIRLQQKSITDSIRTAGTTLINQRAARLAEMYNRSECQDLNNSTNNFVFNFKSELDRNKVFKSNKPNTKNEEPLLDLNGKKLRINIRTTRAHNESLPPSTKKIKNSQHVIIEI